MPLNCSARRRYPAHIPMNRNMMLVRYTGAPADTPHFRSPFSRCKKSDTIDCVEVAAPDLRAAFLIWGTMSPVLGFPWLRHVSGGGGYASERLRDILRRISEWAVEIFKRSDTAKGFTVLPRRWVVERTLAWLNPNRRLAKGFEQTIALAAARLLNASRRLSTSI